MVIIYIGDFDLNGRVDGFDLANFATAFESSQGDISWKTKYDLDGNGRIDGFDLAILYSHFGEPLAKSSIIIAENLSKNSILELSTDDGINEKIMNLLLLSNCKIIICQVNQNKKSADM